MGISQSKHRVGTSGSQGSYNSAMISAMQSSGTHYRAPNPQFLFADELNMSKRVMVVVDRSEEAEVAIQWSLTHVVHRTDTLILLHVLPPHKPSSREAKATWFAQRDPEEPQRRLDAKSCETANSIKALCKLRRPEVRVEIVVMEGDAAGEIIVSQVKKRQVSLLVLGQPKPSLFKRALAGSKKEVVEYCIQNVECLALAVRKKGGHMGGYLINSKKRKNFWMLA